MCKADDINALEEEMAKVYAEEETTYRLRAGVSHLEMEVSSAGHRQFQVRSPVKYRELTQLRSTPLRDVCEGMYNTVYVSQLTWFASLVFVKHYRITFLTLDLLLSQR